jgi:NADPH-dependent ferric siderophore reductase
MERLPLRMIRVRSVARITPHMARVTFGGDELADFAATEPDQQLKLYFPRPGQAVPRLPEPEGDFMAWYQAFGAIPEPERPWMRSYTLRAHHSRAQTIDVDFVLHEHAGPATRWALAARPGDTLAAFGPSAYFARRVPLVTSVRETGWLLLAGDETALPAIGALIESLPAGARALVFVEVADAAEEQRFVTRGDVALRWLHRDGMPAGHGDLLRDAVRGTRFPPGQAFAWLAGEAGAVRALRRHLVDERGIDRRSVDFAGHWRLRLSQDDAPTAEDIAEAQERLADA